MPFSEEQIKQLKANLDGSIVKTRRGGGRNLSYIEGWKAIEKANEIFGFDGWHRTTEEMRCVFEGKVTSGDPPTEKDFAAYVAKVRVSVAIPKSADPEDGDRHPVYVTRHGTGYGSGFGKNPGEAHEGAVKEAETDAMKRALMTFGWQFGLALYDKEQEHVTKAETTTGKDADSNGGTEGAGVPNGTPADDDFGL